MPARLKPRCRFCGRKCKSQGLWSHEKYCQKGKFKNTQSRRFDNIEKTLQTKLSAVPIQGTIVDDTSSKLQLDDHSRQALEAVLDNVFAGLTLEEKIDILDPRDPSNPEGL